MIRDILVGAKADDLFDNRCRDGKRRTWSRETDATKWKLVTDETQSLYELGMTEKGQILCEFQVLSIKLISQIFNFFFLLLKLEFCIFN